VRAHGALGVTLYLVYRRLQLVDPGALAHTCIGAVAGARYLVIGRGAVLVAVPTDSARRKPPLVMAQGPRRGGPCHASALCRQPPGVTGVVISTENHRHAPSNARWASALDIAAPPPYNKKRYLMLTISICFRDLVTSFGTLADRGESRGFEHYGKILFACRSFGTLSDLAFQSAING